MIGMGERYFIIHYVGSKLDDVVFDSAGTSFEYNVPPAEELVEHIEEFSGLKEVQITGVEELTNQQWKDWFAK
jgi:hypothetical protein